jgi:hypothetical protein
MLGSEVKFEAIVATEKRAKFALKMLGFMRVSRDFSKF